jgi:glucosyl-3-phosphoglycerate synthase
MSAMIRTFDHHDFDAWSLVAAKGDQRISVCLPAHNEEATVATIVERIIEHLVVRVPLVDEVVVVDDHSADATAKVAAAAGARVIDAAEVLPGHHNGPGKGTALWKSVHEAHGDLIVWCDADVTNFSTAFVVGLLGPLLGDPSIEYVKGFYRRPLGASGDGGGRVTELVARPLMSLLFPELTEIVQPLSGEYAGRRRLLERLPFVAGYGVEVGFLIDIARGFGLDVMAQVDLGTRRHRNRSLAQLGPQAMTIMQVVLRRADPGLVPDEALLIRPDEVPLAVDARELPPLVSLATYRDRHGAPRD